MSALPVSPVTVFIAHEPEHVSLASAVVDLLEESIAGAEGRIGCSALPGYASDLSEVLAYRRDRTSPSSPRALVVGLPSLAGGDSTVGEKLQAAHDAQVQVILLTDIGAGHQRSQPFPNATHLTMDVAGLTALVEDVAYSLRVRPRFSKSAREALSAVVEAATILGPLRSASSGDGFDVAALTPLRPVVAADAGGATSQPLDGGIQLDPVESTDVVTTSTHEILDAGEPISSGLTDAVEEPEYAPVAQASRAQPPPPPPRSAPMQSQAVRRPPVSALQAVHAGVDLCDCQFAELDRAAMSLRLQTHFAPFFNAIGGDFERLSRFAGDDDDWQAAVDDRIEALPAERAWIGQWFSAGYQLSILCNLASLPPGGAPEDLTTEAWGDFCAAAAQIGLASSALEAIRVSLGFPQGNGGDADAQAGCLQRLQAHAHWSDDEREGKRPLPPSRSAG